MMVARFSLGKPLFLAMIYVKSIKMRPMLMPGTNPARNRAPIDVLVRLQKTSIVRQGGFKTPIPPAEVTKAAS